MFSMVDAVVHHRTGMKRSAPYSTGWYHFMRNAALATRKWRETNTLTAVK